MIILIYQYYESTTTVGVFSSEEKAKAVVQEFLDAYKKQEEDMVGYWDSTDDDVVESYRKRFKLVPADVDQVVDRSVGFVYDWI